MAKTKIVWATFLGICVGGPVIMAESSRAQSADNHPLEDIPIDFHGFKPDKVQVFNLHSQPRFDIGGALTVLFAEGPKNQITMKVSGNDNDVSNVHLQSSGDEIKIFQGSNSGCGGISINNVDGDIVINGTTGSVTINGHTIIDNGQSGCSEKSVILTVTFPAGMDLDATTTGSVNVTSTVHYQNAKLDLSGSSKVNIPAQSLDLSISGSSKVTDESINGSLRVDESGASSISAIGAFNSVHAEISGASSLRTRGKVQGNFDVSASGASNIDHRGSIGGRIRQRSTGASDISIQ